MEGCGSSYVMCVCVCVCYYPSLLQTKKTSGMKGYRYSHASSPVLPTLSISAALDGGMDDVQQQLPDGS